MNKLDYYIQRYKKLYQDFLSDKRAYKKLGKLKEMERSQKLESKYSSFLIVLEEIQKENQALINGQREILATYNAFINIQYKSVSLDDNDILDFEHFLNCR